MMFCEPHRTLPRDTLFPLAVSMYSDLLKWMSGSSIVSAKKTGFTAIYHREINRHRSCNQVKDLGQYSFELQDPEGLKLQSFLFSAIFVYWHENTDATDS
jgi:hypothetical protein